MAIATTEPSEFISGDSVTFIKNLPDYQPQDGWTLHYVFINESKRETVQASDNGDGRHLIEISAADSKAYKSGSYKFFAYVTDGTDRFSVSEGALIIKPDYTSPSFDPRTHVKKVLDALEAVIEDKATEDQLSVTINGRSIQLLSPLEILKWRDKYKAEYVQEQKLERIKKGLGHKGKIQARFR